jgi:hypothetical protein
VDAAALFPEPDGFLAKRAKTARAKLVAGIREVLAKALAPGETIRFAARGTRYAFGEFYFAGWAAYYHNQTALVLTDRRLLVVHVGSRGKPADIKFQLRPEAIRKVSSGVFSGFALDLADGTKLKFTRVPAADRKRLGALLPAAADPKAPKSATPSIEHLCPACLRLVPGPVGATLQCPDPSCRIPFRDPARAARLSAIVPGLGDLYLRHHLFGAWEFLGSMALLGIGIGFVTAMAAERDPGLVGAVGLATLGVLAIPRVVDYFLTRYMGRKGLVPLALAAAPGAQVRNLPDFPRWAPLLFAGGVALTALIALPFAQGVRGGAEGRTAVSLAQGGDFDAALEVYQARVARREVNEAERVRLALALRKAGDMEGSETVQADFDGTKIDGKLADEWNALVKADKAAFEAFRVGVEALAEGKDTAAWPKIDQALRVFAPVKRPHLPRTRGEVLTHLAGSFVSPPFEERHVEGAVRFVGLAKDAPPSEVAIVRAALASIRGDGEATRAALGQVGKEAVPLSFQILALEARARVAAGAAERRAIAAAAEALPEDDLDDDDLERLAALTEVER